MKENNTNSNRKLLYVGLEAELVSLSIEFPIRMGKNQGWGVFSACLSQYQQKPSS